MPTGATHTSLYCLKHKLVPVLSLFSFATKRADLFTENYFFGGGWGVRGRVTTDKLMPNCAAAS